MVWRWIFLLLFWLLVYCSWRNYSITFLHHLIKACKQETKRCTLNQSKPWTLLTHLALIWLELRIEDEEKSWKQAWTPKLQKPQKHDFNTRGWNNNPTKELFQAGLRRGGRVSRLKYSSTCLLLPTLILHWNLPLTFLPRYFQPILTLLHCQWRSSISSCKSNPSLYIPSRLNPTLKSGGRG